MLLTLTCTAPNARDIGYVLAKHPNSTFTRSFSAGTVHVFYPEVTDEQATVALLIEIDPVGLVRGPATFTDLDQYVNDRPYVASSLTSVALRVAFSSALSGTCTARPELVAVPFAWRVHLPAVDCDAGADFIQRIFVPLGYTVSILRHPLDTRFPAWGESDLYSVTLDGSQTTRDLLSHLYVLLPVLDNAKHYYVNEDETEKLLVHGGAWLVGHPERELITRRYLRYRHPLVRSALERLAELDPPADANGEESTAPEPELAPGLHTQRLEAVVAAIREAGATSLVDLGCGEGRLLKLALSEKGLHRILGIDVSSRALALASRWLHLETMPETRRARIQIAQGSLLYRDARLTGFDVAALVEVIEHLDPPRLAAMEQVVFAHARPRRVIVTTPNREYNAHWDTLGMERMRHGDHRFEWTRAECQAWAERIATIYGYTFTWQGIGPDEPELGTPSQMLLFDRHETGHAVDSKDAANG